MKKFTAAFAMSLSFFFVACTNNDPAPDESPAPKTPAITYAIGAVLAHDTSFFTEGLEFYKGRLLESTGLEGKSKLVAYDPVSGKVQRQIALDPKYFGEGISVLHDTLYQLTYREGVVHVYTAGDFKKVKELAYNNGEGWGLTHDSTYLIGTNSGNNLFYYDPQSFKIVKTVPVMENGAPAINVNELEYINGYIYANQWQYNTILKIDPATGNVVARMDLTDLVNKVKAKHPGAEVLNGIAYDSLTKKVYITGKNWPEMYELRFDY